VSTVVDTAVSLRVQALVERYSLPAATGPMLGSLLETLSANPHAPTTVRDPARAVKDHLADSLVALELDPTLTARAIADLGSGAGFPGLPLAAALPDAGVELVESNARKCEFIELAAELAAIGNVRVIHARAEEWPGGLGRFDLVTARALAPLAVVAEYAAPLLKVGGSLLVWRGRRDPLEEQAGAAAAAELGLEPAAPLAVEPYEGAVNRHLHLMSKVMETPDRFPRRPGIARKRPLGGAAGAVRRRVI
jgi:16S rRNA (guanine527-N7)-methyltransferase